MSADAVQRDLDIATRATRLLSDHGHLDGAELLEAMILTEFPGRIALNSSFGAEAAVTLHLVSKIDPTIPVIFLDTGKMFGETKRYRDQLRERFGLTDVRSITPDQGDLACDDPNGVLWQKQPDSCCYVRRVAPLQRALEGFDCWITGRKRFHGGLRTGLPVIEAAGRRVKINPVAAWTPDRVRAYFDAHDLPEHPLTGDGYLSIGCMPCTERVPPGGDVRDGRWKDSEKTECGIHL